MLDNIFEKTPKRVKEESQIEEKLTTYIRDHMPDLEPKGMKTSYATCSFIFKMNDPMLSKEYQSAKMRSIYDAITNMNGSMVTQDGENLIITIPRKERDVLRLGDGIDELKKIKKKQDITCYIGENVEGDPMTIDFEETPHLLVAGRNGSGKSNCMHGIVLSLLTRYEKTELQFYMLDPKKSFTKYEGIPSVIEVAKEKGQIISVLEKVVKQMDERFSEMEAMKLSEWNHKYPKKKKPHIIIVFDEIDTIIGASYQDSTSCMIRDDIKKIAKQGRSAGIHLILASQRPTKANLDTNIKSELQSRIAFKLDTPTDSRVMLNRSGAEHLTGKGDGYYLCENEDLLVRFQAAYVSTEEIEKAIKKLKKEKKR